MKRPPGYTLVELLVVVVIVSTSAGVASVSIGALLDAEEPSSASRLATARRQAIEAGRPVVVPSLSGDSGSPVLFLPDGRALGTSIDPSTGRPE